jgi:hypothetical protein
METKLKYQALEGSVRELLTADRTYYVRTDGNDSNTGLTNTAGGAFMTVQKAVDTVATLDRKTYIVTIQVGNGTYTQQISFKDGVGSRHIVIKGDTTTPANVVINGGMAAVGIKTVYYIQGFKFTSSSNGIAVDAIQGSLIYLQRCEFGGTFNYHLEATGYGQIIVDTSYTISGACLVAHASARQAFINLNGVAVTTSNTPSLVVFADVRYTGVLWSVSATFAGTGATAGSRKYSADTNGVIQSGGLTASYPGGTAGFIATGGQVL